MGLENNLFNIEPSITNPTLQIGGWSHFDSNLSTAMNNAGLAFERTYTREYPQVFNRYQAHGGNPR